MRRSPHPAHGSLPAVLLQAAQLRLACERARAPHPTQALRRFVHGQLIDLTRLARLGPTRARQLWQLEMACAEAGLGYPCQGTAPTCPWQLPEACADLPATSLPPHPLIDPRWLAELAVGPTGAPVTAMAALSQLLADTDSLPVRWQGLPRLEQDGALPASPARVAVCLHLFYLELWPTLYQALQTIPEPWDLYVTVPAYACTPALERVVHDHPAVRFLPSVNRGRDVLPFLRLLNRGVFDRYDAVCKLHSKRSPHMGRGSEWLDQVLSALLGSTDSVQTLLAHFRDDPSLGLLGPKSLLIEPGHPLHRAKNHRALDALCARAGLGNAAASPFFAGTMFWFRPAAMAALRRLNLNDADFPIEMAQTDGTPAHALERLFWPLLEQAGWRCEGI